MEASDLSLLFRNKAGQLRADTAGFLRMHWTSHLRTLADTQAMFASISAALLARGWSKVLINQVDMQPFLPTEQQWITQEWLPQAVQQAGYRYGAVLVSTDIFTRLATAYITTSVADLPLRYRSFDQEQAAVAWLRQQPG